MDRRRPLFLMAALSAGLAGCSQLDHRPPEKPASAQTGQRSGIAVPGESPGSDHHRVRTGEGRPELTGPQPVEAFIARALAENRTVQAAYHNVQSLKHRLPQVTSLDDPVASNVVFPIPSVAPQYFLMGYNPYNLTLAQQFPWFGTLRSAG